MDPNYYVKETLEIELNRLKYEERTRLHYTARNENNQAVTDRWSAIEALERAIAFSKKLSEEHKYWTDGNPHNTVSKFWNL